MITLKSQFVSLHSRGVSWGALGASAPRGHQRGAKKRKGKGKKERKRKKKEEKKGKRKKKGKKGEQERKRERKKVNLHDERGAMQF